MTKINNKLAHRALSFLVLIALVAGSVIPAFSQTRRTRRKPRLGRYTRPVATPVYHTVSANQIIRVRMEDTISSGGARIGDTHAMALLAPSAGYRSPHLTDANHADLHNFTFLLLLSISLPKVRVGAHGRSL